VIVLGGIIGAVIGFVVAILVTQVLINGIHSHGGIDDVIVFAAAVLGYLVGSTLMRLRVAKITQTRSSETRT
jgi:uncharacterized membrane protein